ncbi:hypothetical protein CQA65_30345, partial [Klebsiella pneumoniae]
ADQVSDPRLKKEWRTRALGLRAWLVENDHYYQDRVDAVVVILILSTMATSVSKYLNTAQTRLVTHA